MRSLYVVPIIHTGSDMGSMAGAMDDTGNEKLGEDFWRSHKQTVDEFWNSVAAFFHSLRSNGIKLYQDGLIADGELGLRIVEEGIKAGSKNYEIVAHLLGKGATLVRTEDFSLVKREYDLLSKVVNAKSPEERITASIKFKVAAKELLIRRDAYIAERIAKTLGDGETGVLFIGAYHSIIPLLPADIVAKEIKETQKVRAYHTLLTDPKRDKESFANLAEYLIAPVAVD